MNAPVTRRALLGATAAVGVCSLPAVAEAGIPAAIPVDPDAALFRLLDSLPALQARSDAAAARADALWAEFCDLEPERPDVLRVRSTDRFGTSSAGEYRTSDGEFAWFYEAWASAEGSDFRAMTPERREWRGERWVTVPDEARMRRRDEILAALDRWWDECDVVRERLGIPQADEEAENASDALDRARDAILSTVPLTFAGLARKAAWATGADVPSEIAERCFPRIVADVVAMAGRGGVTG